MNDRLQELLDRQAIAEGVQRYARGIDRRDVDLVASCYHPDAIDDHGTFIGTGRELAEWAIGRHEAMISTQNHITTHLVELDGDTAHGETYYHVVVRDPSGIVRYIGGRYIDRFERRDGEWRIAARLCLVESMSEAQGADMSHRAGTPGARDHTDPSYQRPLMVRNSPQDNVTRRG
jgi:ketosteroid isomerase-like protein